MTSRNMIALVWLIAMGIGGADAEDTERDQPEIKIPIFPKNQKPIGVTDKKVEVVVENAELARIVREALAAAGARMASGSEEADIKVTIQGAFAVSKNGAEQIKGMLRDIPLVRDGNTEETLKYDSTLGKQIVMEGLITRSVSITELLTYLGQRIGVAGAFNKALTGNANGICVAGCDERLRTVVTFFVTANSGNTKEAWTVQAVGRAKTIALGPVLESGLNAALMPFVAITRERAE